VNLEDAIVAVRDTPWRSERRAGVDHFVTGQHRFFAVDDPETVSDSGVLLAGVLAYVPHHGHSVAMLPLHREDGEWGTTGAVIYLFGIRNGTMGFLPEDFEFSEAMRAVLPS
jgi:hypothetical protein